MFKVEEKVIRWVEQHLSGITLAAVTALGLYMRFGLRDYVSEDCLGYLFPWYDTIKANGGLFGGLREQVGTYNLLFQFIIALLTCLPCNSLYAFKLLSIVFDYGLGILLGIWVYEMTGKKNVWSAVLAYTCVICSPVVILNSAAWAQCDVIFTFFVVASLRALFQDKYGMAFVMLGIAFAFKLQALFILPLFLFVYFVKRKFSVLYFLILPVVLMVSGLPNVILGGRAITDVFTVYFGQADYFGQMFMGYPSFWVMICSMTYVAYENLKTMAMVFTLVVLAALMLSWFVRKVKLSRTNMLYMAFLIVYTCILFLPGMHERYGFCYEILAIVIAFLKPKTIPLLLVLHVLTLNNYASYLFQASLDYKLVVVANMITYVIYLFWLNKDMECDYETMEGHH